MFQKCVKYPEKDLQTSLQLETKKSVYFAAEQKVGKEGKNTNKDMAKDKKVWEC